MGRRKEFKKLLADLKELENAQADLRKQVIEAYKAEVKDIPLIAELSQKIRENRRKTYGLRHLNRLVYNYWKR